MPTKREAQELSEFFKFKNIGQVVAGQVDKFGKSGKYDTYFMVLSPVLIRQSAEGTPQKFGSVAIGLSADLLSKINMKRDVGRYISVEFVMTEPTDKGSDKKIFEVNELSVREFDILEERSSGEFKGNAYRSTRDAIEDESDALKDDDDLPF